MHARYVCASVLKSRQSAEALCIESRVLSHLWFAGGRNKFANGAELRVISTRNEPIESTGGGGAGVLFGIPQIPQTNLLLISGQKTLWNEAVRQSSRVSMGYRKGGPMKIDPTKLQISIV